MKKIINMSSSPRRRGPISRRRWIPAFAGMTIGVAVLFFASPLLARPLFTEEAATIGRLNFESGFSITERWDKFGNPKTDYKTVLYPVRFRLGVHPKLDLGFSLRYVSQRLETEKQHFSGSASAQFAPELKWSFHSNVSLFTVWRLHRKEKDAELPIAQGGDLENQLLFLLPTVWPVHVNLGYSKRNSYVSRLGIKDGPQVDVKPGDVIDSRLAMEIPLPHNIRLTTECAYYHVAHQKIAGERISGSAGEAMDGGMGLTWQNGGFFLGGGVLFGLLDEAHSSFALDRGAGDVTVKLTLSYRLTPRRPGA